MWKQKLFRTKMEMDRWVTKNQDRMQWEEIFVNNGYGVEYRPLRRIGAVRELLVIARSLISGDWGRDHAAPGAVSYSRIPNINAWKRTRSVRFPRRVRREVLTIKGKYVIEPSEDGVVLWVNGKAIGDFGDDQSAVNAARRHYVRG